MTLSAPTLKIGATSATDGTAYTTGSYTTTDGALIIMWIASGGLTGSAKCPDSVTHSGGVTMTKVADVAIPNVNLWLSCWKGVGNGAAGTFTITHPSTQGNCLWQVEEQTSELGTPVVVQSATLSTASTGAQGPTLAATPDANSCVWCGMTINYTSAAPTLGTGMTAIGSRLAQASPTGALWSEYDITTPPAQVTWSSSSSSGKSFISIETADPSIPAGATAEWWDGTTLSPSTSIEWWDGSSLIPATIDWHTSA